MQVNFTGETITDNIKNRLHKKLVKLRFEHGTDVRSFPKQMTTSLDRVPNYLVKVDFRRSGSFWNYETHRYEPGVFYNLNIKFGYGPGGAERFYSGGSQVTHYPYDPAPKSFRWENAVDSRSTTFITDVLEIVAEKLTAILAMYDFPDVYVKRGAGLTMEVDHLRSDKHLVKSWWETWSEGALERIDDYMKAVKDGKHPSGLAERWLRDEQSELRDRYQKYLKVTKDIDDQIKEVTG